MDEEECDIHFEQDTRNLRGTKDAKKRRNYKDLYHRSEQITKRTAHLEEKMTYS